MKNFFATFVNDEQGQDLIEYTLLLAFVALASAALFTSGRQQRHQDLERRQHQPVERGTPASQLERGGRRRMVRSCPAPPEVNLNS